MNTQPTLHDLRSLITADNAAQARETFGGKHVSALFCSGLLAELNNELHDDGEEQLDPLFALPLLKDALRRLHQIHEKKRLAWAALAIARKLLADFANDSNSSQEDGGELCDTATDWTVIWPNDGIDIDAQTAEHVIERLNEVL